MNEKTFGIVKAYETSKAIHKSVIIVIPHDLVRYLGDKKQVKGKKFLVKLDAKGRIIYEII